MKKYLLLITLLVSFSLSAMENGEGTVAIPRESFARRIVNASTAIGCVFNSHRAFNALTDTCHVVLGGAAGAGILSTAHILTDPTAPPEQSLPTFMFNIGCFMALGWSGAHFATQCTTDEDDHSE